jgi:hypothetical protein
MPGLKMRAMAKNIATLGFMVLEMTEYSLD